jgi:GNAT superfamily N-acetyltransferase
MPRTEKRDSVKSTRTVRVVYEPRASVKQQKQVENGLYDFNMAVSGHRKIDPVNLFVKDARGKILGGLLGHIWGGWLYIRILWVSDALRGTGYGTKLMRAAEAVAKKQGCAGIYLDTLSFQARPFYEKLGYRVFGTMEDLPVGHTKYNLAKRLTRPPRKVKRTQRSESSTSRTAARASRSRG